MNAEQRLNEIRLKLARASIEIASLELKLESIRRLLESEQRRADARFVPAVDLTVPGMASATCDKSAPRLG